MDIAGRRHGFAWNTFQEHFLRKFDAEFVVFDATPCAGENMSERRACAGCNQLKRVELLAPARLNNIDGWVCGSCIAVVERLGFRANDQQPPSSSLAQQPVEPPAPVEPLLPCPFCGGNADLCTNQAPKEYGVMCAEEGCQVNPETRRLYPTKSEAVTVWNKRMGDK